MNNAATNPQFGPLVDTPEAAIDRSVEVNIRLVPDRFRDGRGRRPDERVRGILDRAGTGSLAADELADRLRATGQLRGQKGR